MNSRSWIPWGVLIALLVAASPAQALTVRVPPRPTVRTPTPADIDRAKKAYTKASGHFGAGRHTEALKWARTMYKILPNPSSARILATVHSRLGNACQAADLLAVALDLKPSTRMIKALSRELRVQAQRCGSGMGWMRIHVTPKHAEVTVSGVSVPSSVTLIVGAGAHPVAIRAEGWATFKATLKVAKGKGAIRRLKLYRPGERLTTKRRRGKKVKVSGSSSVVPKWVVVGAGGVLAITGLAIGLSASYDPYGWGDTEVTDESMMTAGIVVGSIGLVALVTGIVLVATHRDRPKRTGLFFHPILSPKRVGLGVRASF